MGSVANMLVDGEWQVGARQVTNDAGEFERQATTFRETLRPADAEPDRYHVYISRSCPWAHGVALVRTVMGLENVISLDVVDPVRRSNGWEFSPEQPGCTPDTANGVEYLREVYTRADPSYTGRVTVPVLWDRKHGTIVNNESIEIMRDFATSFAPLAERDLDLYPARARDRIDEIIDDLYDPINNGVYRAGFAGTQTAYEDAVTDVFAGLDHWESVLGKHRYLAGDTLTLADLRLFPTLVRFDQVYHTHFKCNVRRLIDYPNLWNYTKDLYQLRGVPETVVMDHIKRGYYQEHTNLNPRGIVPIGPDIDYLAQHDRDRLPGTPPSSLTA